MTTVHDGEHWDQPEQRPKDEQMGRLVNSVCAELADEYHPDLVEMVVRATLRHLREDRQP